ncbi:hypothetical protein HYH03_011344 [Edaphochlamys debaryana]|uniref:Guanylate cyclase domain-containing protein n=1 Tax=Edaphochlamys debaryana TaxID=47281 RepID=A0A835Y357_9CHLO|nr:hypothetical protein HYH03_011344 [Edaphochlamys debaryana]|eukprot:KAG2490219.1 hypothetical protein HYH03_011344 [Edaphochlamys debaryana]
MPGASRWRPWLLAGALFWCLASARADIATTCMARELAQGCGPLTTRRGNLTQGVPPPWARLIHAEALCEGGVDLTGPEAPPAASGTYLVSPSLQGFKRRLGAFELQYGLRYNIVTFTDLDYLNRRYRFTDVLPTAADPGSIDFWSLSAEVFGMPEAVSSFLDTTLLLFSDPAYGAADIPSDWRAAMSSASTGSYCSIPGTVLPTHMYYRTDIFAVHNISVPATWDELLKVAEAFHGRDMDGDGLPEYGICMDTREACGQYGDILLMVLATMVQARGPTDGVAFDPSDLSLLATGEALAEAIRIYRGLIRFGLPPDTVCRSFYTRLLPQGRCIMAFGFPLAFKIASHAAVPSRVSGGKLGTAPLPGSERVLDRPSGRLVPCTPERCPFAQRMAGGGGASGQEVLVNTVVAMDSISFAINRFAPPHRQAAAFRMLATLMAPAQQQERILAVNSEGGPFRASQLDLDEWVAAGYDPANTRSYLVAYRAVLESPNVSYELRFPGVLRFKDAFFELARALLWGNSSLAAAESDFRATVAAIVQQQGGVDTFLVQYRKTLGIVEQKKRAEDEQVQQGQHTKSTTPVATIVVSVVASVLVAVAALVALVAFVRLRRRPVLAQGQRLDAPGPGVAVLCITDIESSTCLWETLTADVCQAAVSLHHAAIRTAAQQHRGYESATEGDSFILAFRSSHDCLRFCLRVQEALLALDWPPELLDSPYAATLAVRHDPAGMQPWVRRAVGPSLRPLLRPPGAAKRNDAGPSDSRQAQKPGPSSAKGQRRAQDVQSRLSGDRPGDSGSGSGSGTEECPGILLASQGSLRRHPLRQPSRLAMASVPVPAGPSSATAASDGDQSDGLMSTLLDTPRQGTARTGLRVRMGFHRGVLGPCDVNTNQASQRVMYSGPVLQLARAIGDVGRGGQVLMSTAALASLNPQQLASEAAFVLHSGRHVIKPSDSSSVELYSVFGQGLLPRTVFMEPPRSHIAMAPGVLEAPLGRLAVAVAQVEELGGLGPQGVMGVYGTLRAQAQDLAASLKGYLLLTGPGALQAVFHDPAAAARWCLQLMTKVQALHRSSASQDEGIAEEKLPAELEATSSLSVRGGVDVGNIEGGLTFDGRLWYKGTAYKAAGCLAAHANWGEVLVSGTLVNAILGQSNPQLAALHATPSTSGAPMASSVSLSQSRPLLAALTAAARSRSLQANLGASPDTATTRSEAAQALSRYRPGPLDLSRASSSTGSARAPILTSSAIVRGARYSIDTSRPLTSPAHQVVTCESPRASLDITIERQRAVVAAASAKRLREALQTRSRAALLEGDVGVDGRAAPAVGPMGNSVATALSRHFVANSGSHPKPGITVGPGPLADIAPTVSVGHAATFSNPGGTAGKPQPTRRRHGRWQ